MENVLANNDQNVKMRNKIVMRKIWEISQRTFAGVAFNHVSISRSQRKEIRRDERSTESDCPYLFILPK